MDFRFTRLGVVFGHDVCHHFLKNEGSEVHGARGAPLAIVVDRFDVTVFIYCAVQAAPFICWTSGHTGRLANVLVGLYTHRVRADVLFEHWVSGEFERGDTRRVIQQAESGVQYDVGGKRPSAKAGEYRRQHVAEWRLVSGYRQPRRLDCIVFILLFDKSCECCDRPVVRKIQSEHFH